MKNIITILKGTEWSQEYNGGDKRLELVHLKTEKI